MIGELPITLIFGGTKAPKSLTINADPGILVEGEVIKIERHIDNTSSKVSKWSSMQIGKRFGASIASAKVWVYYRVSATADQKISLIYVLQSDKA